MKTSLRGFDTEAGFQHIKVWIKRSHQKFENTLLEEIFQVDGKT